MNTRAYCVFGFEMFVIINHNLYLAPAPFSQKSFSLLLLEHFKAHSASTKCHLIKVVAKYLSLKLTRFAILSIIIRLLHLSL